jgi:hypothetical protein
MNRSLLHLAFVCLLCLLGAVGTLAQTTQTSVQGVILGADKSPLPGATVQLRNESTGFTTGTVSNAKGEYLFKELPLGGPYTVRASYVGFGEQRLTGYTLNQGDAIRINLTMQETGQELNVVEVVASGLRNKVENFGAATTVTARTISTLPINGRNFTTLTDLSPLAGRGGNLSGQLGSSTNFTIDGTTAKNPTSAGASNSRSDGPYTISLEAVREFKVITNQYDVVYGRAGGGIVSAVTKAGTNQLTGTVFNFTRANQLASRFDIRGNPRTVRFSTNQFGFALGGPIIKDKLHYFAVWERQIDSRPLFIADIQSSADELRFNVTRATLDRYVDIGRRLYGVANTPQYGQFDRVRNSDAAFLRLDWQINPSNLLTIRNNFTSDRNPLGLIDNTAINIFESTGDDFNVDNSLLATLRSTLNPRLTNELKVQHLHTYQLSSPGDQLPEQNIPRALVENVVSSINGANRATNIQLGGHRFAQEGFTNNVVQLINNLYYNTNRAQFTFGVDLMYTGSRSTFGSEVNGRFHFTNDGTGTALDNFERQRPYRFFREVPLKDDWSVRGGIWNAGVYGQMATKLATGLDMTLGLRFDYAHFPRATLNQAVLDDLGLRTDNRLQTFIAQPRVQFTWDVNEQRRDIIRVGAGVFASDINNYALINNLTFDGSNLATVDVRFADVPAPNFVAYRQDYNSIPTLRQFQLPTINMTGASARVPTLYKANVSYTRFINDRLKVSLSGFMSLARNNYTYVDRNMVAEPFFRLPNEGNRGVFVPLNRMNANGTSNWLDGRVSQRLGRVLELTGDGRVNQMAVVVDGTYRYFRDGEITASYTWSDVRDNTSYNGNVANTATLVQPVVDDPRNLSRMTYSDNQFRHKLVIFGTLPTFWGVSLGVRYSGLGGTRYTLLSGVNSNGDFVTGQNDLAYVFDRNSPETPANIRTGLQNLLDSPAASQSLKDYVNAYSGRFAERNGGINAFYGIIDVRAAKRFRLFGRHGLEISAEIFNFANMLNRSWGVNNSLTTQALYAPGGTPATATAPAVPNFDATNVRFNYRVNATGVPNPTNAPFQVQAGLRYSF